LEHNRAAIRITVGQLASEQLRDKGTLLALVFGATLVERQACHRPAYRFLGGLPAQPGRAPR
jgi:hypothetical protein